MNGAGSVLGSNTIIRRLIVKQIFYVDVLTRTLKPELGPILQTSL